MRSLFSASFQSGRQSQMLGALGGAPTFGRMGARSLQRFASFLQSSASGSFHASPGAHRTLGQSSNQSVGAAEYGSSFPSLRARAEAMVAKSGFLSSSGKVACSRAMPNPSINRTCPGKPGPAGYLKR